MPVGLGLRVQHPGVIPAGQFAPVGSRALALPGAVPAPAPEVPIPTNAAPGGDGLVDFDSLNVIEVGLSKTL